jgi:hypothetical protein
MKSACFAALVPLAILIAGCTTPTVVVPPRSDTRARRANPVKRGRVRRRSRRGHGGRDADRPVSVSWQPEPALVHRPRRDRGKLRQLPRRAGQRRTGGVGHYSGDVQRQTQSAVARHRWTNHWHRRQVPRRRKRRCGGSHAANTVGLQRNAGPEVDHPVMAARQQRRAS